MDLKDEKSYKQRIKKRWKEQITNIRQKYQLGVQDLVLVMDIKSAFKMSNLFSVHQLVSMGITFLQRLQLKRKKLNKHALYYIEPTKDNITLLMQDYSQELQQYRKVHILFTSFVEKAFLRDIAKHKPLLKRIARNSIKEFYHSCVLLSDNNVNVDLPYLALSYGEDSQIEENYREVLGNKFVEVLANVETLNKVRVFYKKSVNKVCQRMAFALQKSVNRYLGILIENKSTKIDKNASDVIFLLLDRSVDTVSPFMHYFTYESMLFDLERVHLTQAKDMQSKSEYSYEEFQNQIYEKYRYRHIAEALDGTQKEFQIIKQSLEGLKQKESMESFKVKELTETFAQLKTNFQLMNQLWRTYQMNNLEEIAQLEQSLATGLTSQGVNTSSSKLLAEVISKVKNPGISRENKLRLGFICLSCIKCSKKDYQELLGLFKEEDKNTLKKILYLGITYSNQILKTTKTITKQQQNIAKKRLEETGMPLNRYTTIAELIVPLFCAALEERHKIDEEVFGEVCSRVHETQKDTVKYDKSRMAFIMLGGISWTEVSAIRSIKSLSEITILSDSFLTPAQFLSQIQEIKTSS